MNRTLTAALAGFLVLVGATAPTHAVEPPVLAVPAPESSTPLSDTKPTEGMVSEPPPQGATPDTPAATAEQRLNALEGKFTELSKRLTVTTASGDVKLILGGNVVADILYNQKRPIAPGTPFLLAPGSAQGRNQNTFDANARQTNVFLRAVGPTLGDWQTGAMVLVNLYDNSIIADQYGLLPILAFGEMRNQSWRLTAGLQHDIFCPIDPVMLPFSKLAGAGNNGAYRLNAQATRYFQITDSSQVDATLGISEPVTTIINNRNVGIIEDNGWPNVEGRLALLLGESRGEGAAAARPIELGVSGVVGELRRTLIVAGQRTVTTVWGISGDARVAVSERLGFRGEVYVGQALGEYNGGIFQSLGDDGRPVRSVGGWGEVYYYICPEKLHMHVGYGIDDPLDRDLGPIRPVRNDAIFANLIWETTKQIRVGWEVTYRTTGYGALPDNRGWGFQTQFQYRF